MRRSVDGGLPLAQSFKKRMSPNGEPFGDILYGLWNGGYQAALSCRLAEGGVDLAGLQLDALDSGKLRDGYKGIAFFL